MNELDSVSINFSEHGLMVLNVILGLIMFGISLELKKEDFISLVKNKRSSLVALTAHFILLPLLTFALVKLLHPPPSVALGMILVGACPGGTMSNMFTHLAKGNTALAVGVTSVSHIAAIIFTPLNFSFYGSLDEGTAAILRQIHLSYFDVFVTVVLIIGVPLTIGFVISTYRPLLAEKLTKIMKPFSLIAFGIFLVLAFAGNAKVFIANMGFIMPLVIAHNLTALASGYLFARVFKLSHRDCKTVTFETGVQNSGLGLILIFSFFNGMGGMALIAATWGIWHLVSGGALAFWWSKRPEE